MLGKHEEADGPVAEYEFPRREHLTVGGHTVKSSGAIESASEVVFQQLAPGRAAEVRRERLNSPPPQHPATVDAD